MVTDPIADMLTRIRNAINAKHKTVEMGFSNEKHSIAKILFEEGYIEKLEVVTNKKGFKDIVVTLKSELFVDPAYETAITPGKEFELFTTTVTNVTNDGEFSNYFSLNITDFQHSTYHTNFNTYKRYFISRDVKKF